MGNTVFGSMVRGESVSQLYASAGIDTDLIRVAHQDGIPEVIVQSVHKMIATGLYDSIAHRHGQTTGISIRLGPLHTVPAPEAA